MSDLREQHKKQIDALIAQSDLQGLRNMWSLLLSDEVPQVVARQSTGHLAQALVNSTVPTTHAEDYKDLCEHCLEVIKSQAAPCDDADFYLREGLFDYYVGAEQFKEAANTLAGLNLEGAGRSYTGHAKAEVHVKIAEAFLEDDETDAAENYVNKASAVMHDVQDWQLQLRYRTVSARVLDAHRKFLDAAMRFYDLSQAQQVEVDAGDLLEFLGRAITCAILGKAGPQRSRVLGMLFKDERLHSLVQLPSYATHEQVLTKMYMQQILRKHEMEAFEKGLMEHQKARMGDGLTIPEKAVIEHNMSAAARVYDNVSFSELGDLLGIAPAAAERVAARMIKEGRLQGSIDQVSSALQYGEAGGTEELQKWDECIAGVCSRVNACVEAITTAHPQLVEP